jgi:hypothetical protein
MECPLIKQYRFQPFRQKLADGLHVFVCDHLIAHTIAAMTVATNAMAMAMLVIKCCLASI